MPAADRAELLADARQELEELSALVAELVDLAADAPPEEQVAVRLDELVARGGGPLPPAQRPGGQPCRSRRPPCSGKPGRLTRADHQPARQRRQVLPAGHAGRGDAAGREARGAGPRPGHRPGGPAAGVRALLPGGRRPHHPRLGAGPGHRGAGRRGARGPGLRRQRRRGAGRWWASRCRSARRRPARRSEAPEGSAGEQSRSPGPVTPIVTDDGRRISDATRRTSARRPCGTDRPHGSSRTRRRLRREAPSTGDAWCRARRVDAHRDDPALTLCRNTSVIAAEPDRQDGRRRCRRRSRRPGGQSASPLEAWGLCHARLEPRASRSGRTAAPGPR